MQVEGDNVVKNFEEKFKELRVEGHRKESNSSASVMFTEEDEYFNEEEMEEESYEDDQEESQTEMRIKKLTLWVHKVKPERDSKHKIIFRNRYNGRQSPHYTPNHD